MRRERSAECEVRSARPLLALLAVFLLSVSARAQGVPADGTEILRGLLKFHGFQPVEVFNPNTASTLVVIVGDERIPAPIARRIPDVLNSGGGLLVVSDGPFNLRPLLPPFGNLNTNIRITGLTVENDRADRTFRGNAASPYPKLAPGDPTLLWMAKRGAPTLLATRHPSTITSLRNPYLDKELLFHADGSHYEGGDRILVNAGTPLAAMSDPANAPGLAMAVANRALVSNEFMVAADANGTRTDNFLYAFLVTRMIAQRMKDNGAPLECLFIEDRVLNTDFDRVGFVQRPDMNLPPGAIPPLPPLPVLLDFAFDKGNELLDKVEEKDIPNAFQQRDPNNRFQEAVLSVVAVVLAILLIRYALARGWGTRHSPELAPRVRIDPDRGGFIPERRYSILESGNLYEPMRDHLRVLFANWGAAGDLTNGLPLIATDRPSRPVRRIAADLLRLWTIAYGPERTPVSPDDLEELEDMISELSKAHEFGVWRFAGGTA
jgi:hypothetical protein